MTSSDQGSPAPDASAWATVQTRRTVLFVVHNTTTLNRLLCLFGVFNGDMRVQFMVTSDLSDPFADGLAQEVAALGLPAVPWQQAIQMTFDLVISASHHGNLARLHGPLVILPHGNGFNKYAPGSPGAGSEERSIFGLSPEWLLADGEPVAAALVFSHPDQVAELARQAPGALPSAVVAGDPCYDSMLLSESWRPQYRAALGVTDDRAIVVISSTWAKGSLLGTSPDLIRRLVADLPVDSFQVVLVAHPNVWSWHGPFQLRTWLADTLRAGLIIIPPLQGWQAALVAGDCVIGDHGSVTAYAAALGKTVLLASFPEQDVVPGSPADSLGRLAPRLDPSASLREQVETASGRIARADTPLWPIWCPPCPVSHLNG